jgi:drug/metabolite transporter (DMT)-like permease
MNLLSALAPGVLVVLWSSGFVGATLAARTAAAGTTLLWRYVVAAILMAGVVAVLGRRFPPSYLVREGVIGVLGQGGYLLGVFYAAERGLPAGTIALVASLQPALVAVVLSFAGEQGGFSRVLGLALGLLGVAFVVGGGPAVDDGAGVLAAALGMLALSVATLIAQAWPQEPARDVLDSLAVQSVVALGVFAVYAAVTGTVAPPASAEFWAAIIWLVVLSFLGGYGAYLLVLRTSGAVAASAWLYLTPATAAVWAWLMFDEALTGRMAIGFAVAVTGVCMLLWRRRPADRRLSEPEPQRVA